MKIIVNFMRRLTSVNVLWMAYLKHGHCSQLYSVRHVFVSIIAIDSMQSSRI